MDQAERSATKQAYEQRQREMEAKLSVLRQQQAVDQERRLQIEAESARNVREQVGAIHRGEGGVYGDLIRVVISGGTMEFYGKRLPYEAQTFTLANGERRLVEFKSSGGGRHVLQLNVPVSYVDGVFALDSGRGAQRFVYAQMWKGGAAYRGVNLPRTTSAGQDIQVNIEIVSRTGEYAPRPPEPRKPMRELVVTEVTAYGYLDPDMGPIDMQRSCFKLNPLLRQQRTTQSLHIILLKNGSVKIEPLSATEKDPIRRKKVCKRDGSWCELKDSWMTMLINGRQIEFWREEVMLLRFNDGSKLMLVAADIEGMTSGRASDICFKTL